VGHVARRVSARDGADWGRLESSLPAAHFWPVDMPRVQLVGDASATALLIVGIATAALIQEGASWEALIYTHLSITLLGALAILVYAGVPAVRRARLMLAARRAAQTTTGLAPGVPSER
jgi:hypothetical protein